MDQEAEALEVGVIKKDDECRKVLVWVVRT